MAASGTAAPLLLSYRSLFDSLSRLPRFRQASCPLSRSSRLSQRSQTLVSLLNELAAVGLLSLSTDKGTRHFSLSACMPSVTRRRSQLAMAPPTLTLDIPISSLPLRSRYVQLPRLGRRPPIADGRGADVGSWHSLRSYSHSSEAVQLSCDTFTILPVAASPLPFAIDGDFTAGTPSGFAPEQVDGGSGAGAGISAHHEGWTWGATMSAGHEVAKATTPPPASLRQGSPSSPSVFTIPNPSPNSNSGRPLSPLSPSSLSGYSSIMPRSDSHRPKRVRKETAPKAASPPPPAPTSSSVTIEDAAFLTAMLVPPPPPPRRYRSKPKDHAPRPPNAWILYRSAQIQILKKDEELSRKPQSDICT